MGTSSGKHFFPLALLLFLVLFSLGPAPGHATTWTNPGTGDWHDSANWNLGIPTNTIDAFINNGGAAQIVSGDADARNLTLGAAAGNKGSVELINNYQLYIPRNLTIGNAGEGYFSQGDGGVTAIAITMGSQPTGHGTYNLDKGTLTVAAAGLNSTMRVGAGGTGLFQQTGGEVTAYGVIELGQQAGSQGNYILENGSLTMPNVLGASGLYLGYYGIGGFDHRGGTVSLNSGVKLGILAGSQGNYSLKSGTLTVGQLNDPGGITVGDRGIGNFYQDSGIGTVHGSLSVGAGKGGVGNFYLKDGSLILKETVSSSAALTVGDYGKGYFEQSGSVVTVDGRAFLGGQTGGEGKYSLIAGSLSVGQSSAEPLIIGSEGKGEFLQQSGEVKVTRELTVGWLTGGEGKYFIKDGTLTVGSLNPGLASMVGGFGTGLFEQQGGTVNALGTVFLGYYAEGKGTYSLIDGILSVGSPSRSDALTVGFTGTGLFEQQGGAVAAHGNLSLGYATGGNGSYFLTGGNLAVGETSNPADMYIGRTGSGLFSQEAGVAAVSGKLYVGTSGIFTQTGGTFTAASADNKGQMTFDGTRGVPLSASLGDMTNQGAVKVTNTTVTFNNYTESGSYTSDPATTIILGNLLVEATGFLLGGSGDLWQIGNDFLNESIQNVAWNTNQATLQFFQTAGQDTLHNLQVPGLDKGQSYDGYSDNFAWGTLDLTGQELSVLDYGDAGGGFYLRSLAGLLFDSSDPLHILNIDSPSGLNLYYDPIFSPELHGFTYSLDGGGFLLPVIPGPVVPLPGSVWLMLSGLVGLAALKWRRN
jgi:hypothetical protein